MWEDPGVDYQPRQHTKTQHSCLKKKKNQTIGYCTDFSSLEDQTWSYATSNSDQNQAAEPVW